MHPVVLKNCGHRMWLRVVSICDVTLGGYYVYSAASVVQCLQARLTSFSINNQYFYWGFSIFVP